MRYHKVSISALTEKTFGGANTWETLEATGMSKSPKKALQQAVAKLERKMNRAGRHYAGESIGFEPNYTIVR